MWMKRRILFCFLTRCSEYLVENRIIQVVVEEYERPLSFTKLFWRKGESLVGRLKTGKTVFLIFLKLAYLPAIGQVRLRLSKRKKTFRKELKECRFVSWNNQWYCRFEGKIQLKLFLELYYLSNKTIATAESCTGGIASLLSSVAGSSAYFRGSIVSYAQK
jgi:nicotinamide-nucleotide amidase